MALNIINRKIEGVTPITPEQIRDKLRSIPDGDRVFIITDPEAGEHKIYSFQRRSSTSLIEYDYEGVPES